MPTLALKDFFLAAKQGTSIVATIVPQTYSTGGTLTAGSSSSLRGQFKRIKITSRPTKDNVSSVDSPIANNLLLEENLSVELDEMQRSSVGGQVLSQMNAGWDIFAITFGYAHKTYGPVYVTRNEFSDGIESKGNGVLTATFDLIDVGQTGALPYAEA